MMTVSIPWAMWYGDDKYTLTFPDSWELVVAQMKGGPDIGDQGIRRAFAEPKGVRATKTLIKKGEQKCLAQLQPSQTINILWPRFSVSGPR